MIILVIDGQGGGIGSTIIKGLREITDDQVQIWAIGTNAIATAGMMKAGANKGATGENAIVHTSPMVDTIVGPLAVVMPNAMMGEVTRDMVEAICSSKAQKILLPLTQENVHIVGTAREPLPHLVAEVVNIVRAHLGE